MSIEQAVDLIIEDLCDRMGLGPAWEECDEEIQEEIRQEWIDILASNLKIA